MAYLWQWCPFYLCGHLTSPVPVVIQVLGQKCAKWLVNCDLCVPVCTFVLWRTWQVSSSISSWGCDSLAQDHSSTLPYTSCGVWVSLKAFCFTYHCVPGLSYLEWRCACPGVNWNCGCVSGPYTDSLNTGSRVKVLVLCAGTWTKDTGTAKVQLVSYLERKILELLRFVWFVWYSWK